MLILENYLKSIKVQKVLNTKPGEEGFSLVELVVVIAVLAILSAVAIPAFVGVQANARASAVKNALVNGVKECVVRSADNRTTLFAEAQSFANADAYQGYTIEAVTGNSTCYAASATADPDSADSDFTIVMNETTGVVTKSCTDVNAPGCDGAVTLNDDGSVASTAGSWWQFS